MKVRIFKPSNSTMQSAPINDEKWRIEVATTSGKKPEPLMGWTSSKDTLSQIEMGFDSKEAAIAFAEKEGWQYSVANARQKRVKPRNYMDNFRYIPAEEL